MKQKLSLYLVLWTQIEEENSFRKQRDELINDMAETKRKRRRLMRF